MRIVHVAPLYHPVIGGIEEVMKKVAEYMASRAMTYTSHPKTRHLQ
ncbi:hypothetical protein [Vulcanisaeta thermophila]|nr:hypothetical protein [Vulcanisaeta thermophila]